MVTHDSGDAGTDIFLASPKERKTLRWAEIRLHNSEQSPWLVINGKVYDVTQFQTRHPGGDMILLGAGRHSTELFLSHHPSSVIESKMLDKFYIGDVAEEEDDTKSKEKLLQINLKTGLDTVHLYAPDKQTQFYSVLRHRVEDYFTKNNLKPRDSPEMYLKTFISVSVWLFLYLGTHYLFPNSWALSFLCAVLWGFANANIGMSVMHDGNHGGYSNKPIINRIMGGSFDFLGGSSFVWKMIHSVGHHVHTNVEELDPDIHTAEPHFRRIKGGQKHHFWYRYQHIYLPFMYSILVFELFLRDFIAMMKGSWGGVPFQPAPKREWVIFWVTKVLFVVNFFLVPYLYSGDVARIAIMNCTALLIAGELLVLMFQVNHVTKAASTFNADSRGVVEMDWAKSQVEGSSNFASGSWLWNHISGGLNHQTEHHLFPTISHVHYPKLHPIVKKTCDEFNVQFNSYPNFFEAIKGHFALLRDMGAAGIKYDYHID